jgi:hypothetical protein
MRTEHKRRIIDDFRNLELIARDDLVYIGRRGTGKQETYTSFMPKNPFVNSAVSSMKSRGRELL